jgi:hypothetical protein
LQQIHPACAKLYFTKTLQEWVAGLDLRAFFSNSGSGRSVPGTTTALMARQLTKEGGIALTTITIYKPNGDDSVRYMDPNSILIEKGVLSFYWTKEITGKKQKIVTTLPFLIQHDMNGMPNDNIV